MESLAENYASSPDSEHLDIGRDEDCSVTGVSAKKDKFSKRTYLPSQQLTNFFTKIPPRQPASGLLSSDAGSSVQKSIASGVQVASTSSEPPVTKQWIDHQKETDKEKRKVRARERRALSKVDKGKRKQQVLEKIVDAEMAITPASNEAARGEIVSKVLAQLTGKKRKEKVVDEEDHLRTKETRTAAPAYYAGIDSAGRRILTPDNKLFFFEQFRKHHGLEPIAKEWILDSGAKCRWSDLAKKIARENPNQYGEAHPCGSVSRAALRNSLREVALGAREIWVGRRRTLPQAAINLIIATISAIISTDAYAFSISVLRPVALGVIAGTGFGHFLTNGGKGSFTCSRWWLSDLFRKQKWAYRSPQKNSHKLPTNWKEAIHDMVLRAVYFVATHMIPSALFVNADHTGIMQC